MIVGGNSVRGTICEQEVHVFSFSTDRALCKKRLSAITEALSETDKKHEGL